MKGDEASEQCVSVQSSWISDCSWLFFNSVFEDVYVKSLVSRDTGNPRSSQGLHSDYHRPLSNTWEFPLMNYCNTTWFNIISYELLLVKSHKGEEILLGNLSYDFSLRRWLTILLYSLASNNYLLSSRTLPLTTLPQYNHCIPLLSSQAVIVDLIEKVQCYNQDLIKTLVTPVVPDYYRVYITIPANSI